MDLDTQQYTSSTHLDEYGLDDLPEFDCLCELCDCGCFEASKQPHSLNCKRFFNQASRVVHSKSNELKPTSSNIRRSHSINNIKHRSPNPLAVGPELPKGILSEYQVSFANNSYTTDSKAKFKVKDNISLFTDNGKPNESYTDFNNYNLTQTSRAPLRSKTLNRLNNMMPNNESASWYQSDFNFIGTDDPIIKPAKSSYNSLDHYKKEYLRNFEELNKGLVDNYSVSKGSPPLVSTRENNNVINNTNSHSRTIHMSQDMFRPPLSDSSLNNDNNNFNTTSYPRTRPHDFRPVWIPKKYDGRNMFASHIDSALFPDKERKEYETQYHNYYDSSPEKRVTFDRDSYVGKFPSYRYIQNYENKLIPTMKWTQIKDTYSNSDSKVKSTNEPPSKSIYQADFDTPQIIKKSTLCKAALVQTLMRRDKQLALKLNRNQPKQLKSVLKQRYNDIQTYNIF